jgi:hypothetical protein
VGQEVAVFLGQQDAAGPRESRFGFDDAGNVSGNVYGSWTGKMAVRRWTKS